MKVVLVSSGVLPVPPTGYGGLEQIVADLAICLDRMGHEVSVVAPAESTIGREGKIRLIEAPPCNPNAHAWEEQAYQTYRPMMDSEEFKDAIWHDHSWRKFVYLAKQENPALHVTSTLHGMLCYGAPPRVPKPCLIGLSKRHSDQLSAGLGVPVRYAYNGIDLDKYKMNGAERNDRFLFLARITAFKGAHTFADLMKQMGAKGDLVGDDSIVESQEFVERVLMQCNDYPDCRYWGGVSRERTSEFFQACKAYVLPLSPGWEEPFGLTVIEANACGCSVIATRSGAIPELIENGVNGYVAETTHDLENLLSDDNISRISPEVCRERAEQFSREKMAEAYVKLYEECLGGGW